MYSMLILQKIHMLKQKQEEPEPNDSGDDDDDPLSPWGPDGTNLDAIAYWQPFKIYFKGFIKKIIVYRLKMKKNKFLFIAIIII